MKMTIHVTTTVKRKVWINQMTRSSAPEIRDTFQTGNLTFEILGQQEVGDSPWFDAKFKGNEAEVTVKQMREAGWVDCSA